MSTFYPQYYLNTNEQSTTATGQVVLNIRQTGFLCAESERYLAGLIVLCCRQSAIKHLLCDSKPFHRFSTGDLINYVVAGTMTCPSAQAEGFLSSSRWLSAVLALSKPLSLFHMQMIMSFVNANATIDIGFDGKLGNLILRPYASGKELWSDAPLALKNLLDFLDDALVNKQTVKVVQPIVSPRDPQKTLNDIEGMIMKSRGITQEVQDALCVTWS